MSASGNNNEATTLREYLDHHEGRLYEGEIAECARQILNTLKILHAKGIVHGNIRPSNIVIKEEGIELSGFRISDLVRTPINRKLVGTTGGAAGWGQPQNPVSYPELEEEHDYAAPHSKLDKMDPQYDLYSVAVLCYKCLTGKREMGPIPPSQVRPDINSDWDTWIHFATNPQPSGCFGTAQEMAAEIPQTNHEMRPDFLHENLTEHIEQKLYSPSQPIAPNEPISHKYFWLILGGILCASTAFVWGCIYYLLKF